MDGDIIARALCSEARSVAEVVAPGPRHNEESVMSEARLEMQAAVLRDAGPMRIEDVELSGLEPGEVRVKLSACGVCHSDLHTIHRARRGELRAPVILGHEAAGIVDAVGASVRSVAPGDPVILAFHPSCGRCAACVRGTPQICERPDDPARAATGPRPRRRALGTPIAQGIGVGGFAQYTIMPEGGVIKVRPDAPLGTVCLVGCAVTTGIGAVMRTARVEPGSDVAVIGLGGVGLNIVQGARLAGARRIIGVDVRDDKLALAERFGATDLVRGGRDDTVEQVRKIAGNRLDYAFEAIGLGKTVAQALQMVRAGGTAVSVGVTADLVSFPGFELLREKKLIGSFYGSASIHDTIPRLVDLYMDGRILLDELVSRRRPLAEVNEAFEDLEAGSVARSVIEIA
jgi:S-(hydroxymethyl)glutathione dehydrogenase/alcohol dehydrogenase